jgi:hypothetical protein
MERVLLKIAEKMKKDPSVRVFTDMYNFCREVLKTDVPLAVKYLVELSEELDKAIPSGKFDSDIVELYALHKNVWLAAAPEHFESYLFYLFGIAGNLYGCIRFNQKRIALQKILNLVPDVTRLYPRWYHPYLHQHQ